MLKDFIWNMTGYIPKHQVNPHGDGIIPYVAERIKDFLGVDGGDLYDTDRFIDIKLSCREQMLQKLMDYDPAKGAARTPSSSVCIAGPESRLGVPPPIKIVFTSRP